MKSAAPPHNVLVQVVLLLFLAATAGALETDQYYTWGSPLEDSTEAVNAKLTLELERALASFSELDPPEACVDIAVVFRKRLRFVLFHHVQLWAINSSLVARIPRDTDEQRVYRRSNLYSIHPFIDTGTWMPFTPTIEVAGVRMGTDKISHLVSSGWTYYSTYRGELADGANPLEAKRSAVRRGLLEESLILGGKTSGVLSIADLEASLQGLSFYRDLCDGNDPILQQAGGEWLITRAIDLRNYVGPRWDESFQPSIYNEKRWRKILPVLKTYCDRLDDPQVVAMRARYRSWDAETLVGAVVAEFVEEGKLEDPARFAIEPVCSSEDPQAVEAPRSTSIPSKHPPQDTVNPEMKERVIEEERDRRRKALGLIGIQLTTPQMVAISLGVMATSQPRTYDCRMVCDFWGPFAQIEPGLAGGKLSVGWGRAMGSTGRRDDFLSRVYLALAVKGTVLRTWGDYGPQEPGRTFAGAELEFSVARVNFGLGLLYRVDDPNDSPWLITAGIGWGF